MYHFCFVFFPGVFFHSRVTGACPVTAELIMRVNVITATNVYQGMCVGVNRLGSFDEK